MDSPVNLSLDPENPHFVSGKDISSVFVMRRHQGVPPETRISLRGGEVMTPDASAERILNSLEEQGVTLLRQPGKIGTTASERYVGPHLVDFVLLISPQTDGTRQMLVGTRDGGHTKTEGVTPAESEDFLAAVKSNGKTLRPLSTNAAFGGFSLNGDLHIDPKTIALIEESLDSLDVYCLGARPVAIVPVPKEGNVGSTADGIHALAETLSGMNGKLVELPSVPVVFAEPGRVLSTAFGDAAKRPGIVKAELELRAGTAGSGRLTHEVTFRTEEDRQRAAALLDATRRTPTSLPPPAM